MGSEIEDRMEIGRFKNKADTMTTVGSLIVALLISIFYEGHGPPATTKSNILIFVGIVIFCSYRIIKHLIGYYITWNLKKSYVLVCVVHLGFYLLRDGVKLIYERHYIGKYDLAVFLSFILIVLIETFGKEIKSK